MPIGKIAVFSQSGIQILTEHTPSPKPDELLARLIAAGICGSDVHRVAGDIASPADRICFGHEAVGTIEEIGDDVKEDRMGNPLRVGDIIYWCPSTPCGTCRECTSSNVLHCRALNWPARAGSPNAAGFREYATLNKKCTFIRVPEGTSPLAVVAFGCAMPTAIRGFAKLAFIAEKTDFVIQGDGPVGLACVLLARLVNCRSITVIGDKTHRLHAAKALGATNVISISNTTVCERATFVHKITGSQGPGVVIEAAGTAAAFSEGFDLLGMGGQYLILGLYSGKAACAVDPVRINNYNLQIIGSLGIDPVDYDEAVKIASIHGNDLKLSELVTHKFPLERLGEAIKSVGEGIPIKAVVYP
ncbi:chaperonin 10-like protein [Aspergillus sergii]|uniref:Chaperonin 10-like protein n=1 Tax=Aspergillus sergii TaxID=1034303 RepID=A0A5N6XET4_9EURO|nr:chaperonin 10-like protein [Aspergillus sergii]